jgi:hypothetical protein
MLTSLVAAALLFVQGQALDKIVVTTTPPLDAQRLSDALRVYLDEFGIRIENASIAEANDLSQRIADARRLGESVRAVAVIRAGRGTTDEVEIELVDLQTQKTLLATVTKPTRDEDLYRTLALKIQAILRATLSEARGSLDPKSAVGRLVSEPTEPPAPAPPPRPPGPLTIEAGYDAASFPTAGVVFQGLAIGATYSLPRWFDLAIGTVDFGSVQVSGSGVNVFANLYPLEVSAAVRLRRSHVALSAGPVAEAALISVTASGGATATSRDMILALGGQATVRIKIAGPAWGYLRAAALGVLLGPSYDVGGVPLLDTSRLELGGGAGLGVNFP